MSHYFGLAQTLNDLALLHMLQLLDCTTWIWRIDGLLESEALLSSSDSEAKLRQARLMLTLRLRAYLYDIEVQAWERFCAELHLDPEMLVEAIPGYATAKEVAGIVKVLTLTPEKAGEAARLKWGPEAKVQTVESVLADFRAALAEREKWWG